MQILLPSLVVAVAAATLTGWMGARPPDPSRGPRLIPWRLLMLLSVTAAVAVLTLMAQVAGGSDGGAGRIR